LWPWSGVSTRTAIDLIRASADGAASLIRFAQPVSSANPYAKRSKFPTWSGFRHVILVSPDTDTGVANLTTRAMRKRGRSEVTLQSSA
jgi:hypothetical protein